VRFSLAAAANTGVVGTTGDLFGAPNGVFLAPSDDYLESDDDATAMMWTAVPQTSLHADGSASMSSLSAQNFCGLF